MLAVISVLENPQIWIFKEIGWKFDKLGIFFVFETQLT
jgi:hypothetical protein